MKFFGVQILLFFTIFFSIVGNTYGQTPISGIINNYAPVTSLNSSCNSVTVSAVSGFNIGNRVLLIQMKGATVEGGATNNATFGNITAIGNAGNYEFNEILDIQGAIIYLKYTLLKTYTPVALQLIRVPQYTDVVIVDTLTAKAWDGSTGGVLVFEATGNVEFNADINVEGTGFRGGAVSTGTTNTCAWGAGFLGTNLYSTASGTSGYAWKGEGISEYITSREVARANQANAGGGGHSSNTGAGGGSNYGKGGLGGRQSDPTPSAGTTGCSATIGGRGMGGVTLSSYYPTNKIFMGGGGGGGQQNNYIAPGPPNNFGATVGNPGGGIVIIKAGSITGNSYSIIASGFNNRAVHRRFIPNYAYAPNMNPIYTTRLPQGCKRAIGDSGGGGGGGGTVLLSVASGYTNTLKVDVTGGRGDTSFTEVYIDLGPGGGGGGGVIWTSGASLDPNIDEFYAGGVPGASWNPTADACQCPFMAENGDPGFVFNNLILQESTTPFGPTCTTVPITLIDFAGKESNGKIQLNWSTAMESNNSHFILEKSIDAINFEPLATIKGNGNSSTVLSYSYTDIFPYAGINYYRLKQVDFDGKEHIDGHTAVNFSGNGAIIQKIYPNPFNQELTIITALTTIPSETELKLFNAMGAEVATSSVFESDKIILNTRSLEKGIYILKIINQGIVEVRKVIKD